MLNLLREYQSQFAQSYRGSGFIFRGMSNKIWPLLPSIFRDYPEPQKSSTITSASYSGRIYSSYEFEILAHFKKESSSFLPHIPQNDDLVWLQYAQHFGVPTRLLDFTANPLVALYFCCKSESEEDGIVWLINTSTFQSWSESEPFCFHLPLNYTRNAMIDSIIESIKDNDDYDIMRLKKHLPIMFVPAYIDQRISAQASRFLLWGEDDKPLEALITDKNKMILNPDSVKMNVANDQKFLANIIVAGSCKHSIMRELDLLGINEKTIFPGLDGIGRYVEQYYRQNATDISEFF